MKIISEDRIIKVLLKTNTWWRNTEEIRFRAKPHKRVAWYDAVRIMEHDSIRRFVVLSGARRVGKTTILYQMIQRLLSKGINPRNILYVSLDNPILKLSNIDEILDIYETLAPISGERWLFLDEIQYAKDWELWLKILYDSRADIRLAATGSASPVLEKGATDSGTGRWSMLKVPTMSFYEYCELLSVPDLPDVPAHLRVTNLSDLSKGELLDFMFRFTPLQQHFNRYLTIGGFPELALSSDDSYAQRILHEDVVDKVTKRDILLFNVRNPISMEKLFVYLCMNSSELFNKQTVAKALENISITSIENYVMFLEKSNLIYCSPPVEVGRKAALKGLPKIYIADAAIRNAVLMIDDILSDDKEMGVVVETAVYKHVLSYWQGRSATVGYYRKVKENQKEVDIVISLPGEKILCEVKYRNDPAVSKSDAIVELSKEAGADVRQAFLITKNLSDCGFRGDQPDASIFQIPALPFVYLLGFAEACEKKKE
jgi:predicted AAA+ superfamily ATPase